MARTMSLALAPVKQGASLIKEQPMTTTDKTDPKKGDRIAKVLARSGLCSRREAEKMILAGLIAVDGKVLSSPALNVTPANKITVDGKPLAAAEPTRLWRYHKPPGLVTTHKDPEGRETVFDVLPTNLPRVVSVGRLDVNSEGLLLLTNDGDLARKLELPATGWLRRYRARVFGKVNADDLERIKDGITVDGMRYGPSMRAWIALKAPMRGSPWVCAKAKIAKCVGCSNIWGSK